MNTEEQNIAVAKFHGYKIESGMEHNCRYKITDTGGGVCFCDYLDGHIPDYGKDHNAMNRVEMMLDDVQFEDYFNELEGQVPFAKPRTKRRHVCSASASQRREALLRCLNLWVDEDIKPV